MLDAAGSNAIADPLQVWDSAFESMIERILRCLGRYNDRQGDPLPAVQ